MRSLGWSNWYMRVATGRLLLLGVGGAIWGGGSVGQAKGQGGPDVGFFVREWRVSVDLQAGYGSSRTYGMVSFSRSFGWDEITPYTCIAPLVKTIRVLPPWP